MIDNLLERVARHAVEAGERIAISKWRPGPPGFAETSYAGLAPKATRLARALTGLTPEAARVPMLVGKSAEAIATMLGAIATRRPFSFLNPKSRGPQIAAVLEATVARACVVDALGLVAFKGGCSGAYGVTANPIYFISHAPPKEILVETRHGELLVEDCSQFAGNRGN